MSVCVGVECQVFRGLSRFVGVCRAWGLRYALCVCACVCVGVFVGVCQGFSGFVEPGGYDMPCVCAHVCVWVCLSGFVEVFRGLSSLGAT